MDVFSAYRLALHMLRTLIEAAGLLWLLALGLALLGWAIWIAVHYPARARAASRRPADGREAVGRRILSRPQRRPAAASGPGGSRAKPRPRRTSYERGRTPEPAVRAGNGVPPRSGSRPSQE